MPLLRLVGYIRVSAIGGREGEGYISPSVQREAIEQYARELGGEIVAWYDDQDFSGGNTARPAFQEMLALLVRHKVDGIVVMKIDRFSRSTADGLAIVKEILDRDQIFASCHERIDPKTKEGRYMLRQFLSNAEYFLDQIKESWTVAKARAIAVGKHIGPTPNGYLKIDALPSKPTHISPVDAAALGESTIPGVLVPSPVYGPAMTEAFEKGASGRYTDAAVARWFSVEAPREGGGAAWTQTEVRRWFKNRVYLGEVKHGGLVNADAHKALTDEDIWEACQREPGEQMVADSPFLLRGLIRCAGCRYSMGGQSYGGTGATPVYRCYSGASRNCPEPSVITAELVEGHIKELVEGYQRGLLIGQADDDEADLVDVEAFEAAAREVDVFLADTGARQLMGEESWQEGLRLRVEAREAKLPARDAALARLRTREVLKVSVDDLDRHGLRDLLVGTIRHVFVRRQPRGAAVADRVLVIWSDDTRVIDVPGRNTHNRKVFEPIRW